MKIKILLVTSLFLIAVILLSVSSTPVQASLLDNLKNLLNQGGNNNATIREFTIEPSISLAPDGDVDNNGEIDAGDVVRFTYTITNATDQEYVYGTLKTNINRKMLHFIHNVHGTPSLNDDEDTITIPNLRIRPLGELTISFDASINYYDDTDKAIVTQAEYMSNDNISIFKSSVKQVVGRKINSAKLKSRANSKSKN